MPTIPPPPNMTCDIHHNSNFGVPTDVHNVKVYLTADYFRHTESGEKDPYAFRYTHVMLISVGTYVFDTYDAGLQPGGADTITIPSGAGAAGTTFTVIFVETKARGTPWAYLKVYLDRGVPPWPTQHL